MADIFHYFPIKAPIQEVFRGISTPSGLDQWWSKSSSGQPGEGAEYSLGFGPGYDWRATVSRFVPNEKFELRMDDASDDWSGTRVGFTLAEIDGAMDVRFYHTGWPESNEHFRISSYCWAMYLRILKRSIEHGESVEYEDRLDV